MSLEVQIAEGSVRLTTSSGELALDMEEWAELRRVIMAPSALLYRQAADLYIAGMTMARVAAELGCSTTVVQTALRMHGVVSRKRGPRPRDAALPDPRSAEMAEMYRAGATQKEIGAKYGISRERARQLLNQSGSYEARPVHSYLMQRRAARNAEIARLLKAGVSVSEVAAAVGVSQGVVNLVRQKLGIRRSKSPAERLILAAEMFDAGASPQEIAEALGYKTPASACAALHYLGRSVRRRDAARKQRP